MSFDATQYRTGLCRPHKYSRVAAACDEPTSVGAEHHCIYNRLVCDLSIAFLIIELLKHDRLQGSRVKNGQANSVGAELREQRANATMPHARVKDRDAPRDD
jgi:hypothetical protein